MKAKPRRVWWKIAVLALLPVMPLWGIRERRSWLPRTLVPRSTVPGYRPVFVRADFSADGRTLSIGYVQGGIQKHSVLQRQTWDVASGRLLSVRAAMIVPASPRSLTRRLRAIVGGSTRQPSTLRFDNTRFASQQPYTDRDTSRSPDGILQIKRHNALVGCLLYQDLEIRLGTAKTRLWYLGADEAVEETVFSPDSRILAVTKPAMSTDGSVLVQLRESRTGKLLREIRPASLRVEPGSSTPAVWRRAGERFGFAVFGNRLVFSPDGSTLAVAGYDGTVTLWRIR